MSSPRDQCIRKAIDANEVRCFATTGVFGVCARAESKRATCSTRPLGYVLTVGGTAVSGALMVVAFWKLFFVFGAIPQTLIGSPRLLCYTL